MEGKIALEEHFAIGETLGDSSGYLPDQLWPELSRRLTDIGEMRLAEMDRHGLAMMILSLNMPAIQAIPEAKGADAAARRANDHLADKIARHPDRFAGLAALPMQDPDLACRELERCVRELKFCGALVNGFSQVEGRVAPEYYDTAHYLPFWQTVQQLDVPFYLHPRNPLPSRAPIYEGHSWLLGPTWAFAQETAAHALRLMGSGLFDHCPHLQLVLGHMGENLPGCLWRIDNRNHWANSPHKYAAKKKIADYMRENVHITTSGNFSTPTLANAIAELGAGRIMFSVDYPFESCGDAASWFDRTDLPEADRTRIGRSNALSLFRLAA